MIRKGRSLGIEEKLYKMAVDDPHSDGGDLYREKDIHKYYCWEYFSEISFLQKNYPDCGGQIGWSAIDTESLPASSPNSSFKPCRHITPLLCPFIPPDFDYRASL